MRETVESRKSMHAKTSCDIKNLMLVVILI